MKGRDSFSYLLLVLRAVGFLIVVILIVIAIHYYHRIFSAFALYRRAGRVTFLDAQKSYQKNRQRRGAQGASAELCAPLLGTSLLVGQVIK